MDPSLSTSGIILLTSGGLVAKAAAGNWQSNEDSDSASSLSESSDEEEAEWEAIRVWEKDGPASLLLHEAKIYDLLGPHPGIIACHGLSTLEDGKLALILKRAYPGSVDSHLNRGSERFGCGSQTPLRDRLRWGVQLADAVAFCHSKHIALVDLNSNNVLLDISDSSSTLDLKLCDFGAADQFTAMGTPRAHVWTTHAPAFFLSPKFKLFTKAEKDLFSVGSTLVEILLNKHPWSGTKPSEIGRLHESGVFPPLDSLPAVLRRYVISS
ncbi:hypothetical protein RQP46_002201 [Phenoliferia psychrophenolica]